MSIITCNQIFKKVFVLNRAIWNLMRTFIITLLMLFTGPVVADTLNTTVRTTTTISEDDINSATLSQLLLSMLSFDNKSMRFKGELFTTWSDNYILVTDEGIEFIVSLDDGRATRTKAQSCPDSEASTGCTAELMVDLKVSLSVMGVRIDAIGYEVTFLD